MSAKAIIISTGLDDTQRVVGDVMPLSAAKTALREFSGEEFKKVELFELRAPSKRRKIGLKSVAAPVELPKKKPQKK